MICQPLEARVLLAAGYTFEDGVLTVRGTNGNDEIDVFVMSMLSGSVVSLGLNGKNYDVASGGHFAPVSKIIIHGGSGRDWIRVSQALHAATVVIAAGPGNDTIEIVSSCPVTISGGGGDDWIDLTGNMAVGERPKERWDFPVLIRAGDGDDVVRVDSAQVGPDPDPSLVPATLLGGAGDDLLMVGAANGDVLDGGDGNDTLKAGIGDDSLTGGAGNDLLIGGAGTDSLDGGPGRNSLIQDGLPREPGSRPRPAAGSTRPTYTYSDGVLIISGTPGADDIVVRAFIHDSDFASTQMTLNGLGYIVAHSGGSTPHPHPLASRIVVRGGGGNDTIRIIQTLHAAPVSISAGPGRDRVLLHGSANGFPADVSVGDGDDVIELGAAAGEYATWTHPITLRGGAGADHITALSRPPDGDDPLLGRALIAGGAGDDTLIGGDSSDVLKGGAGDDRMAGGMGNDQLLGGAGSDRLSGGPGRNLLVQNGVLKKRPKKP